MVMANIGLCRYPDHNKRIVYVIRLCCPITTTSTISMICSHQQKPGQTFPTERNFGLVVDFGTFPLKTVAFVTNFYIFRNFSYIQVITGSWRCKNSLEWKRPVVSGHFMKYM